MKRLVFLLCLINTVTLKANVNWEETKEKTILEALAIPGWCVKEKASMMMELIKEKRFQICVEIGVFAGASTIPIARALEFNHYGEVYAIDAWNAQEAVKGLDASNPNFVWWSAIDYDQYFFQFCNQISQSNLDKHCKILRMTSQKAVLLFAEDSIDFIHFDGNHDATIVYQDVTAFFSKVKNGGYILLNDPNWFSMRKVLIFLLERTEIVTPFSPESTFFLFKKNAQYEQVANGLTSAQKLI